MKVHTAQEMEAADRAERWRTLALSMPAVLLVTIILLIPVGWLFWLSFTGPNGLTAVNYIRLYENPAYLSIFQTTFVLSLIVTVVAAALGYPLAYLLSQLPRTMAILGLLVVLLPFWTSTLVRTYSWLVLLQRRGLINTMLVNLGLTGEPLSLVYNSAGVVIGMVHIMLPFMVLPLYAAMKSVDPMLVRAAVSLGATRRHAFFTVFAPLTIPGLVAGSLLVFIYCLGFYITPQILGGGRVNLVSMKILENATVYSDWGAASALGVVLLVVTLLIFKAIQKILPVERLMRRA
ncbi:putative spermidine/putrescine transport system permease protein/spermidine/putrescine transport system permease protein [Rhodoligotrophos appendicifer]|uniref:ABC transporter permease n=1 Tax=Rhodoligotrophos appendicifer TaxID=987056 RepID=UPI00118700B7|nr:ABC transporter permease [Rhodoligotrophos appendicifer]